MSSSLLGNLNLPQELEDKLLALLNAPPAEVPNTYSGVWTPSPTVVGGGANIALTQIATVPTL